jgi:hypothetical protein
MGGLRISPARLRRHGIEAPPLRGDLASDDPEVLRTKLYASAISTVVGELIAVLGRECGLPAEAAWGEVAAAARRPAAGDRHDIRSLLHGPLPVKAMTAMRLAADPLTDQWAHLPNPLGG